MQSVWVRYIVQELIQHPDGLPRQDVIERVAKRRSAAGYSLPKDVVRTVQSAFNGYHKGSSEFSRRGRNPDEALFYPVGGKWSGVWAVDRDKAQAWLQRSSQ